MRAADYGQYETQYRELRQTGGKGWGGENLERRMRGWRATVERLSQSDRFPRAGSRVLEIGSGAGDALLELAKIGYHCTGIEISTTAVEWASEKLSGMGLDARFIQGNIAQSLPFEPTVFDAVLDGACLHCVIGADREHALREIHRVLTPSGFFLVSHMVNDPHELDAGTVFNRAERIQERAGLPYRSMPTFEQLITEVKTAGFEVIHQELRHNAWWDHAELWCLKA